MTPINLVLFGDQTVEKRSSIQSLVRQSKKSAGARRLLREATDLVQLNFDGLSKEDRAWNHEVHTLLGLAEDNIDEVDPNGVIATVLMCIGRLGELIVYAEEDPSILGSEHDPVHVLAFCTGLLPAAALVAARDTSELFEIGREIISVTFRMAHQIIRRMKLIEDTNLSWAITMVGKTTEQVQPILDEFHRIQEVPYPKRIAIGVISNGWLTLMGAPSTLARLMKFSKDLEEAPKIKTDTNGAVHTEYMPKFDLGEVLGDSPLLETPLTSKARMISPASCKPYEHATLRSLLGEIMIDIAHNILRINDTVEESISAIFTDRPVSLIVAGPTGHLTAVQRVLTSKSVKHETRQHLDKTTGFASRGGSDIIAIVGMAGRFPGSDTVDGFFEDLIEEKVQLKKIPMSRFDLEKYFDATGKRKNTTSAQQGAFLDHPGYFDNRLFNVSPREAAQMDPLQRLLLTTSYEALECAGYAKDATLSTQSDRIATYFGQASEDWRDVLNNEDIDIYYVPSISRPFGPSRLSYHHKWGGGTYALDAACATSTTAIQLACSALNSRECDTAVAGGGSLLVSPNTFAGLSRSGMISDTGGCRTYHDDADGFARGEGIGVVVLKRLEDALADNDNILGVVRGSARTYTSTSTSITHPSAESQSRIYEEVLRQTSVVPNEIAYVEMHGTGTQAGDYEEMSSVIKVLGKNRNKDNILTVGAVKANVAHGEGAAGITSLIKVLMMIRDRRIPSQPGLPFKINHNFPNLEKLHVRIAGVSGKGLILKPSPAARDGKIKCLVNSFDASGGNTSLVIEEPPEGSNKVSNPLPCHTVTLSARTITSLQGNRQRLLDYLTRNPDTKLADIAYTTTARRMHEVLRVAYSIRSTRELIKRLREDVSNKTFNDPKTKPPPTNIVFAFSGQGSQYAGMGKQLFWHSSPFRNLLQTYQQMAEHQGLPQFLHLIEDGELDIASESPSRVQLAIVTLEIATAQLLKTWGIKPHAVIGHSLGEYSALCIAGVPSVSDTLFLVGRRARLMEEKLISGQYAMLAIGQKLDAVSQHLTSGSQAAWAKTGIACMNAPQVTVAGASIDWPQFWKEFQSSVSLLPLPTYAFDEKDFWTPFVERVTPDKPLSRVAKQSQDVALPAGAPTFSTASLQWIEESHTRDGTITVRFASHTSEPSLYNAIQGHVVNGLKICSLSIFCDMAKSAAQYAYQKLGKSPQTPTMSIYDVNMTHALVVPEPDPELIVRTKVSYTSASNVAEITFTSTKGGIVTEHGACRVIFEDSAQRFSQLSQTMFLIAARIRSLKDMSITGQAHRLLKPVVYKLFDNLVAYSEVYQGLQEVWVDADCHDAVGTVRLPNTTGTGNFLYNPFWIDCAIHLAGFLVNGSLKYPGDIACLSTGFDSWRLLEELKADEVYTTYVSMQELQTPNVLSGAAYVYDSHQKLVQVTTGIRFQKMKKLVLSSILRPVNSSKDKAVGWRKDATQVHKMSEPSASTLSTGTPTTPSHECSEGSQDGRTTGTDTPASSVEDDGGSNLLETLLSVVASESGCNLSDLEPATAFADIGMDSLMAITIIAAFQRDTGIELPATYFLEHTTVAEAKEALPGNTEYSFEDPKSRTEVVPSLPPASEDAELPQAHQSTPAIDDEQIQRLGLPGSAEISMMRPGRAVLLHGSPSSLGPKLFLFPDGSGSPSRYIQLPALGENTELYGLESPFLKTPADYKCSIQEMCASFLTAIKTVQPQGPYFLGGFSLGALYAYEVSSMLLGGNEQVEGLFIIDMAVPTHMNKKFCPTQEQILEAGLLPSSGRLTTAQKEHLAKTVEAMMTYSPVRCHPDNKPARTILICSRDGLASEKNSVLAEWAKGKTTGSRGWEELLSPVDVRRIEADHFSLFKYPVVKTLGNVLADALDEILRK